MKPKRSIFWLSMLIIILSLITAIIPLLDIEKNGSYGFLTLRGEEVSIFGVGIYKFDTIFAASGFKGQDYVTLFLAIPLLSTLLFFYKKEYPRVTLLLLAVIAFFLYVYASMSFGASYNQLFLLYITIFSCSLFCFILLFTNINLELLPKTILHSLPRKGPTIYLFLCGFVTFFVWTVPLVSSAMKGTIPSLLDHYTTMVTDVIDLAIITPSTFIAGIYILKRNPLGYTMAFPLIGIIIFLIPVIALSTYIQFVNGITFSTAEIIGPVAGFLVLGIFGIGVLWSILRKLENLGKIPF